MTESGSFIWAPVKESTNVRKHGVDFVTAAKAFRDPGRRIYTDSGHSAKEERFFCLGKVGNRVLTVRFTYRGGKIRVIGAGFWRKGERLYERKQEE